MGAVGGAAAAVAATVARVSPVVAANGDPLTLGETNTATKFTVLEGSAFRIKGGALWASDNRSDSNAVIAEGHDGTTAFLAFSEDRYALHTQAGRVRFAQISGVATIKKGTKSKTVDPGMDINAKTYVLLTPTVNLGSRALWYTKNQKSNKITIRMSSARSRPTRIAWLALER